MDSKSALNGQLFSTLRISNIPVGTADEEIRALIAPYGEAQQVRRSSALTGDDVRAIRYVEISPESAQRAIAALHGTLYQGAVLDVSPDFAPVDAAPQRAATNAQPPDDELPSILIRHHYEVASIERAELPDDGKGADWYRYVLSSGRSCITGFHRGSLEEVTEYASGCAAAFNQRNLTGKSARVSAVNPKK